MSVVKKCMIKKEVLMIAGWCRGIYSNTLLFSSLPGLFNLDAVFIPKAHLTWHIVSRSPERNTQVHRELVWTGFDPHRCNRQED